jgi:hypothetical protein
VPDDLEIPADPAPEPDPPPDPEPAPFVTPDPTVPELEAALVPAAGGTSVAGTARCADRDWPAFYGLVARCPVCGQIPQLVSEDSR